MLISLLFLFSFNNTETTIIHTDTYGKLSPERVLLFPDGSLFLLGDKAVITHFDTEGRVLKRFGGSGQGPGEFQYPSALYSDGRSLFVWDAEGRISQFDEKGQFLRHLKPKHFGIELIRVADGWAYGNWNSAEDSLPDYPVSVFLCDGDAANPREITTTKGNGYGATFIAEGTRSIYTPVRPRARLETSRDQKSLYVVNPSRLAVRVFDARTGTMVSHFKKEMPVHPFNPDWANIRLKQVKAMYPDRTYKTNYYENFPVVRDFWVSPDDDLVFRLWTFEPHKRDTVFVCDAKGQPAETSLSWRDWRRWCATWGRKVLLIAVDQKTDENLLVWQPAEKMSSWFSANPLNTAD